MVRLKLLLGMLAMTALLVATVALFSPYAPLVAPAAEDIEAIWAIEDARRESAGPLVTRLENNGVPLAYDRESNTFYCTLGLGYEEAWPDIHLTAPGAKDVQLIFVDDYTYDWCADAIRDGYPYQVMAYTEDEFSYFDLVFTGLMQVCIHSGETLGKEDRPAEVSVHTPQGALKSHARTHYRGGVTAKFEKHPYKIEFTRTGDGRGKIMQEVPTLGQMDQFVLIPMWYDNDFLRDRLSWSIYGELVGSDVPYGARRHAYVELFVGDKHEGLYLLLEPYDHEKEIAKTGASHLETDWLYASCPAWSIEDRPTIDAVDFNPPYRFAMHRQTPGRDPFEGIKDYMAICMEQDDEVFAERMLKQVDIDSMLRYHLILQSFGLGDNVYNNQFVWAVREHDRFVYRFVLWDMDMSWGENDHIEWIREDYDGWMYFPAADRLLNLRPEIRTRWADMWQQMRETVLTQENIEEKLLRYSAELNDSGAIVRNAQRWNKDHSVSDPFEIINYTAMRMQLLDRTVEYIAGTPGDIAMLMYDDPQQESGQIYGFGGREKDLTSQWE
ncbi:MAG: CotH kinase family protein [Clostridia bacterium]|nr:CotH kinase family protein [Clostridia bacterium]